MADEGARSTSDAHEEGRSVVQDDAENAEVDGQAPPPRTVTEAIRARVEIICIQEIMPGTTVEEEIDLNDLPPEEDDQFREQLTLVLEKVEALEKLIGICRDDKLWDTLYLEHGIARADVSGAITGITDFSFDIVIEGTG